jgi:hypothetical protein
MNRDVSFRALGRASCRRAAPAEAVLRGQDHGAGADRRGPAEKDRA